MGAVIFNDLSGLKILVQRRVGGQNPSYHPPTHWMVGCWDFTVKVRSFTGLGSLVWNLERWKWRLDCLPKIFSTSPCPESLPWFWAVYQGKRSSRIGVSGKSPLFIHPLLTRWGAVIFYNLSVLKILVQRRVGGQYPSYHPPTHE